MSLTVEQMLFLAGKGLSIADVIDFAKLNEKPARSANAERQARFRQRQREGDSVTSNVTNNVTDNVTDVTIPSLSPSPNENISNPHPHTHPEITRAHEDENSHVLVWRIFTAERLGKFPVARRIAPHWRPFLTERAQQTVDGWPPGMFDDQLAAFLDHAADKGRTSKDWQAAFRTWITNANRWKPNERNQNIRAGSNGGTDRRSGLARAIDRELERSTLSTFPEMSEALGGDVTQESWR